jgi:putative ATPase
LGDGLLQRWFGAEAEYRHRLAGQLQRTELQQLEALFRARRGAALPQPLRHTLVAAQRPATSP